MQGIESELRRSLAGLRAEQQHAHEWEPWLVYADWLSSRNDPRGALIVLEHRLASTRTSPEERAHLSAEIDALVAEHRTAWTIEGLPASWGTTYRHGFLVGVALSLDDEALGQLGGLLADPRAALLTRLATTIERDDDDFDDEYDFEAEPEAHAGDIALFGWLLELDLSRIAHFAFEYRLMAAEAIAGLAPHLANLRGLDLRYAGVDDDALVQLFGGRIEVGLEVVHLQSNRIGARGLAALLASPCARTLRHLDLRDNPLGLAGAQVLAAAELVQLDTLLLHQHELGPGGAELLATAPRVPLALRRHWAGRASTQPALQP
jgi:uncharacterized protein (TIGR02996 family)